MAVFVMFLDAKKMDELCITQDGRTTFVILALKG